MNDPNFTDKYDEKYQRWYRMRYNHHIAAWEFYQWLDQAPGQSRRDSIHPNNAFASASTAGASQFLQLRSSIGHHVYGNYDPSNPNPAPDAMNYDQLDMSYYVRDSTFFQEGKLFAVLFTEPAGANAVARMNAVTDYNSAISRVTYGEYVHTQVRRFIVVEHKREFCYAIPIFTYSGQGTTKKGVEPSEHAIAYTYGFKPQLLKDEQPLTKRPICIIMAQDVNPLSRASRIYFGIQHPIQYNVKVKDLGYVLPDDMPFLNGYWNMEHRKGTRQSTDVTTEASQDAPYA